MKPLSAATAKIAALSFERKYIALGRIVNNWEAIVGAKLAHKVQPNKLHYRKKPNSKKPDVTLEIAASSADATLLHYQKDLILERINQIFGEQWISAIRFVQVASNAPVKRRKKAPAPLTTDEKNTLSTLLGSIKDQDIKCRLETLGQAIIVREKYES